MLLVSYFLNLARCADMSLPSVALGLRCLAGMPAMNNAEKVELIFPFQLCKCDRDVFAVELFE
jgi:hypothetical protein